MKEFIVKAEEFGVDPGYFTATELIRCKDCKWWKPDKETCIEWYDLPYTPAYGYCSRAERKEDDIN